MPLNKLVDRCDRYVPSPSDFDAGELAPLHEVVEHGPLDRGHAGRFIDVDENCGVLFRFHSFVCGCFRKCRTAQALKTVRVPLRNFQKVSLQD